MVNLKCPFDNGQIIDVKGEATCNLCKTPFPMASNGEKLVLDFRGINKSTDVVLTFSIPQHPLKTGTVDQFGFATAVDFDCLSREEIRKRYGTKLQKEVLYYIDKLLKEVGPKAAILDLGCGKGGNKKYLESLGFSNIVSVDYLSKGAELLVDAHRLPFFYASFDMILTTATLEHFYNPFIAFKEMNRVLKPKGMLIASGSFLESWHANSCFHFTPGGIDQLCTFGGFELSDLWPGWGFIPSIASHGLRLGRFKWLTYKIQKVFDWVLTSLRNPEVAKKHTFKMSGSFGLYAVKKDGVSF